MLFLTRYDNNNNDDDDDDDDGDGDDDDEWFLSRRLKIKHNIAKNEADF